MNIRTDLALEEKERFERDHVEIEGVEVEEQVSENGLFRITGVKVKNEIGAKAMAKPIGTYITIENCRLDVFDACIYDDISMEVTKQLKRLISSLKENRVIQRDTVLVVGLGNREATPDALGPVVLEHIMTGGKILGIAPGVKAQTGMETQEYIRGIARECKAGMIIAIDALAARHTRRLNATIQITDTGIHPGSGVGNHRQAVTMETMEIPVIAIGVPTVVDAVTIVNDVMDNLLWVLEKNIGMKGMSEVLEKFNPSEKRQLVRELMERETRDLYVTSKDIDETIQILGQIISVGINDALMIMKEN